jgi:hypothetical protein
MDGWTTIMAIHEDLFVSWFVQWYFVLVIVVCSFFVLNLTIALMLLKYEEVQADLRKDAAHDSEDRDMFSRELHDLGEFIFGPEHHALVDFIVDTDGIMIHKAALKELKAASGFFKSLFEGERNNIQRDTDPYYQDGHVKTCLAIIEHDYFGGSIMIVIILNTVCLALDRYPNPPEGETYVIHILNLVCTAVFTFECYVRMRGLGAKEYCKVGFNIFDLVTVAMSLIQLAMKSAGVKSNSTIFSILRTFRVFRVFKLFKVGDLRLLLDSIIYTLSTIGSYLLLVSFFVYIFALVGMSSFAGKVRFSEDDEVDIEEGVPPRENFDTLAEAIVSIFEVLT